MGIPLISVEVFHIFFEFFQFSIYDNVAKDMTCSVHMLHAVNARELTCFYEYEILYERVKLFIFNKIKERCLIIVL